MTCWRDFLLSDHGFKIHACAPRSCSRQPGHFFGSHSALSDLFPPAATLWPPYFFIFLSEGQRVVPVRTSNALLVIAWQKQQRRRNKYDTQQTTMVLNVEAQHGLADTSLRSLPSMDLPGIDENCDVKDQNNFSDTSFRSSRDTSHCERDVLETSRTNVSASAISIMHSSILDVTEDDNDNCDDDDEENAMDTCNFLFPDAANSHEPLNTSLDYHPPQYVEEAMSPRSTNCCSVSIGPPGGPSTPTGMTSGSSQDLSLLDRMTESFVESLCFRPGDKKDVLVHAKKDANSFDQYFTSGISWEGTKQLVEYDILELLGCSSPADEDEIEQVWAWNQTILNCVRPETLQGSANHIPSPPRGPRRHSARERASRLHRIRTERAMVTGSVQQGPHKQPPTHCRPSLSPSPTSVVLQPRVRTMDDRVLQLASIRKDCLYFGNSPGQGHQSLEDDIEKRIGFGIDPILNEEEEELRYDSDPEDSFTLENRQRCRDSPVLLLSPMRSKPTKSAAVMLQEQDAGKTVQDCLNSTWTLTWHRGKDVNRQHAVCINAWIERGTLVQSSNLMLEPNLMWREAYQGDLDGKRKLNSSSQKPFSVRLLNLCRILEAPANLDRSIYPLARISCSFLVRTSHDEEFLFEAASPQQRDEVLCRWKICVARFATLAVLEDMEAITHEFFSPMVTSQMLVPEYRKL
jgi:hypothetical protein